MGRTGLRISRYNAASEPLRRTAAAEAEAEAADSDRGWAEPGLRSGRDRRVAPRRAAGGPVERSTGSSDLRGAATWSPWR